MHVPMLCDWFSSTSTMVSVKRGVGVGVGVGTGAVVEVYLLLKNAVLGLG